MSCTAADLWELQNSLKSLFLMFCALKATPHFTIFTQCMFFFYVLSKESPQSLESENIIWLCFLSHLPFPHCLVMCHPQVQHFWTCWDKTKICKPCQMLPVPFNDNDCIPSVLIFLFLFSFSFLGGGVQLHQVSQLLLSSFPHLHSFETWSTSLQNKWFFLDTSAHYTWLTRSIQQCTNIAGRGPGF